MIKKKNYNFPDDRFLENEQKAINNVKLVIAFFDEIGYLPCSNAADKEENRLYEFRRKTDLSSYNIPLDLKTRLNEIYKYCDEHNDEIKKLRSIKKKKMFVDSVIVNYLKFYDENERFALDSSSDKEEIALSKQFLNIVNKSEYHSDFAKEAIERIRKIKMDLKTINYFITYCNFYKELPYKFTCEYNSEKRNKADKICDNFDQINLDDIVIPYDILEKFYEAIENATDVEACYKEKVNYFLEQIILYMEENNRTVYKRCAKKDKFDYKDSSILYTSAINFVKEHIKYADSNLIDKYNSFSFVNKKLL